MKLFTFLFALTVAGSTFAQQKDSPKIVVGVVVDQMVYDYLYRFYDQFGEDGFKRLMSEGANFRNMNYNYVPTYTGPGHASIYTGTTPSNHGIVGNDWYDRSTGKTMYCVEDSMVKTIGEKNKSGKYSPVNLKSNTITDQLKLTYPDAKVISMSIKNRGSILPGGHLSDGSYWYDYNTGSFVTSTYFMDKLPNWVSKFNSRKYAEKYMDGTWDLLSPETNKTIDNRPYEVVFKGKDTPTFPYDLKAVVDSSGKSASQLFPYTPFANTFLTDFALQALENEDLGKDDQTDMLCISYSSPDIIGHLFGPYSREIEDTYIRLDKELARLMTELDKRFGKEGYQLFLTADHAVVPVPQFLKDNGLPGGYFYQAEYIKELKAALIEEFEVDLLEEVENLNIYLNHDLIEKHDIDLEDVCEFVAEEINKWEGVKRVFTAEQLLEAGINDEWARMVSNGYHKEESGDVIFILEAGYLPKGEHKGKPEVGTSHGSPYGYDTHVPMLWYGSKASGDVFTPYQITDIVATLAHVLYLQKPNSTVGKPMVEALED